MWFVVTAVVIVLVAVVVAATLRRGRTSPYTTVRERPPGRD